MLTKTRILMNLDDFAGLEVGYFADETTPQYLDMIQVIFKYSDPS
jgi:hypothetical protein